MDTSKSLLITLYAPSPREMVLNLDEGHPWCKRAKIQSDGSTNSGFRSRPLHLHVVKPRNPGAKSETEWQAC
jgi:hypothetical protein